MHPAPSEATRHSQTRRRRNEQQRCHVFAPGAWHGYEHCSAIRRDLHNGSKLGSSGPSTDPFQQGWPIQIRSIIRYEYYVRV
eukprot:289523-Pyramimonas_sp.AAC.1